jgi:hypothetical protein
MDWADIFLWILTWVFGPALILEGLAFLIQTGSPRGYLAIGAGLAFTVAMMLSLLWERRQADDGKSDAAPK